MMAKLGMKPGSRRKVLAFCMAAALLAFLSHGGRAEDDQSPQPAPGMQNRAVYPPIASRLDQQGRVGLQIYVSEDGLVTDAKISVPSGYTQLDAAALVSVGYWHYLPAMQHGNPVAAWRDATVDFALPKQAADSKYVCPNDRLSVVDGNLPGIEAPAADPSFPHRGDYPAISWWHHDEGTAVVEALIGADGWICDAKIDRSSGSPQLDAAALVIIGFWHYFPAHKNGAALPVWWKIQLNYKLAEEGIPILQTDASSPDAPPIINNFSHPPEGIEPPRPTGTPHTTTYYPPGARRNGEQGRVQVLLTVGLDGSVANPVVIGPSPYHDLNAAALMTVKSWRYLPAKKQGRPFAVRLPVSVFYSLDAPPN